MSAKKISPPKASPARKGARSSPKPPKSVPKGPPKKSVARATTAKASKPSLTPQKPAAVKAPAARARIAKTESNDSGTMSAHGKRIGRPKTRMEELKAVPTRCPTQIYTYLKGITPFLYNSLTSMFEDMMRRFLDEEPWDHGLHWRKPKTAMTFAGGVTGRTGWEQVNMQLPYDLALEVESVARTCGVSRAAFCYTAIFWWVQYIYPPAKMTSASVTH